MDCALSMTTPNTMLSELICAGAAVSCAPDVGECGEVGSLKLECHMDVFVLWLLLLGVGFSPPPPLPPPQEKSTALCGK